MRYGLSLIVLMAMLVTTVPALADFWVIDEFCGMGQLCVGLKERIRQETSAYLNVEGAASGGNSFIRTRSQLYADWNISDFDKFRIQLTNEFRNWMFTQNAAGRTRGNLDEAVFDHFYVESKEIFESPVTLAIGRMDLLGQYGENFIFADGTPTDGSRTFYFDMVRASILVNDQNTVDVLYISNDQKDKKLPRINKQRGQATSPSDDSGPAIILKSQLSDEMYVEPYYVYKQEEYASDAKNKLNTVGAFLRYKADDFTVRTQLAFQFGDFGDHDWSAMGGYVFVDKPMKDWDMSPVFTLGLLYLTGDDPSTDKMEGWNPLYSRFPAWNEIYAYVLRSEFDDNAAANGYWTNTMMLTARTKLKVNDKFTADLALDYFMAPEKQGLGTGSTKGISPHMTLAYAFSKTVVGRYQLFFFQPGSFYTDEAKVASFSRVELSLSF